METIASDAAAQVANDAMVTAFLQTLAPAIHLRALEPVNPWGAEERFSEAKSFDAAGGDDVAEAAQWAADATAEGHDVEWKADGYVAVEIQDGADEALVRSHRPSILIETIHGLQAAWAGVASDAELDAICSKLGGFSIASMALPGTISRPYPINFVIGQDAQPVRLIHFDRARVDLRELFGSEIAEEEQHRDLLTTLDNRKYPSPAELEKLYAALPSQAELEARWLSAPRPTGHELLQVTEPYTIQGAKDRTMLRKQAYAGRKFEELREAARKVTFAEVDAIKQICSEARYLDRISQETVLGYLKVSTGLALNTLRAAVADKAKDDDADVSQLGLAKKIVEAVGEGNLIWAEDAFWRWDNTGVWAKAAAARDIKKLVQRTIEDAGAVVSSHLVNSVVDVLANHVHAPGHRFNIGNDTTINCLNGELELVDGTSWRLKPHQREHFRTTQIPVAYDPAATAPRFEKYIAEVFRDDADRADKRQVVLELIGYTLVSHARHERFVMSLGKGSNGKSVLMLIVEMLAGEENTAAVQPSQFDNKFQRAHLTHKSANIVTELAQGAVIADAPLKAIVSGEPTTVEDKFGHPFTMRAFATCWFGANHRPHTRDFSNALFRRSIILMFNRSFEGEEDHRLKAKAYWATELPGILNLALAAYVGVEQRNDFTRPASSEAAKLAWRREADQMTAYVEDRVIRDAEAVTPIGEIFTDYLLWGNQEGVQRLLSKRGMGDRLEMLGFGQTRTHGGVRCVTGLRLRTVEATTPPEAPVMTPRAGGATYQQFLEAGWTVDQMLQHGYLLKPMPTVH